MDLDQPTIPAGRRRVAILGGGMAGLTAAWRLSEPGWRERFDSITVFQRGWRLGGKGASSRGAHGRIEEHGLHVWLGYYDNAFRLMRDCYEEVDRANTDPACPIATWLDAFLPSSSIAMEDLHDGEWRHWIGHFGENDLVPGDPEGTLGTTGPVDLLVRMAGLLRDLLGSFEAERAGVQLSPGRERPQLLGPTSVAALSVAAAVSVLEAASMVSSGAGGALGTEVVEALDATLLETRRALATLATGEDATRRTWHLVSVISAATRGLIVEGIYDDPRGLRKLNDVDFCDWIRGHGAAEEALQATWVRGLYDLVFGHADGDPERIGMGAGVGCFLTTKIMLGYKGSLFWKMAAGMGDVVFAPLWQALRARGVDIELFHRVDGLHLSADSAAIESITVGRQVAMAAGVSGYDPLVRVRGLPCFPDAPLVEQLVCGDEVLGEPLEAAWCTWPDAERRVLHRGIDFDEVVLALPPPMAATVCRELVEARPEWRAMVEGMATVATQAFQLWLREDEPTLGWPEPGTTTTGFVDGFDTWASMPQLIPFEDWPAGDTPRAIAYFCNTFPTEPGADPEAELERVRETAIRFCSTDLRQLLPEAVRPDGFRWDLLCGNEGKTGAAAFDTQYWAANIDPSDRYVQSMPGTDKLRLRADESGFENLYLAGDWTDNGLNAGCIEGAVLSGLQAANAVLGRHRFHRILGTWLP